MGDDAGQLGARNMSVTWLEIPAGAEQTLRSDEGAEQVYEIELSAAEKSMLKTSADSVQKVVDIVKAKS